MTGRSGSALRRSGRDIDCDHVLHDAQIEEWVRSWSGLFVFSTLSGGGGEWGVVIADRRWG